VRCGQAQADRRQDFSPLRPEGFHRQRGSSDRPARSRPCAIRNSDGCSRQACSAVQVPGSDPYAALTVTRRRRHRAGAQVHLCCRKGKCRRDSALCRSRQVRETCALIRTAYPPEIGQSSIGLRRAALRQKSTPTPDGQEERGAPKAKATGGSSIMRITIFYIDRPIFAAVVSVHILVVAACRFRLQVFRAVIRRNRAALINVTGNTRAPARTS